MPRFVMKRAYVKELAMMVIPISAYLLGTVVQLEMDKDYVRYRNKSQMYGGRKKSVW